MLYDKVSEFNTVYVPHIKEKFPRVLIVYLVCVNKKDQFGVSFRNWFHEWPKNNLAQIYSGGEVGYERYCGHTYKLGSLDRRWGALFIKLKESLLGESSRPAILNKGMNFRQLDRKKQLLSNISNILLESGLWELIFKPVLSEGLIKWVENFKPEVIYCQGYDLTFSWLPLMLSRKFNLPICFQTTDDWPDYLYKTSIVSFLIRPIVHKAVKELIVSSSCRLAFSDSMVVEYAKRYGFPFEKIMLGDNIHRFRQSITRHVVKKEKFSVIYSGKLEVGRWKSLVELCKAAEFLRSEGLDIVVTAFASSIPPEAINRLKNIQNLQILPPPDHEVLPSYLKGADVLFLPESFDPKLAQGFRHSISTKAVLYMMSERPILVYASPLNGVTKYAKCEGWAYVVDQPQNGLLIDALRLLLTNQDFKEKMVRKALKVALKNHDEERIRVRFLLLIRSIV